MQLCPICTNEAEVGRDIGGDYKQFACPRCGNFKISGTALAMLPSRLEGDTPKIRARLSHAIRLLENPQKENEWPEITSVNLDELASRPLPSIERQLVNLLRWAAEKLGDDQLGAVQFSHGNNLAGIIGTIDDQRVDDLLSLATSEGLISPSTENSFSIKRKGWDVLNRKSEDKQINSPTAAETPEAAPEITKAHCNKCNGERKAFVRAAYTVNGSDGEVSWSDTYEILECCGCSEMIVKHDHWFSEWDSVEGDAWKDVRLVPGIKTTYWPPPIKRQKPEWVANISDEILQQLFDELYHALSSDLVVLSTIGARTIFDRASFLLVEDPKGGFAGKLEAMLKAEYISGTEYKILQAMTDVGSASAHRGHSPTPTQLQSIIDILENFVERAFVLGGIADELRQSTPPRQRKKGKD